MPKPARRVLGLRCTFGFYLLIETHYAEYLTQNLVGIYLTPVKYHANLHGRYEVAKHHRQDDLQVRRLQNLVPWRIFCNEKQQIEQSSRNKRFTSNDKKAYPTVIGVIFCFHALCFLYLWGTERNVY